MTKRLPALTTLLLFCLVTGVKAQSSQFLETELYAERLEVVVDESGGQARRLVPVTQFLPGEEVIYTAQFTNVSDSTQEQVSIVQPLPEHMVYVPGSAVGPGTDISFSIDGGANFAAPDELLVEDENGVPVVVAPEAYTHIRWSMRKNLAPGARGYARFRAVFHYREDADVGARD